VLDVTVRDDGRGFDVAAILARSAQGDHLGLLGMHERVRSLGGEMTVDSAPGSGTAIRIRVAWPA
jgi:two-component system sensor histidine kinase UhpB